MIQKLSIKLTIAKIVLVSLILIFGLSVFFLPLIKQTYDKFNAEASESESKIDPIKGEGQIDNNGEISDFENESNQQDSEGGVEQPEDIVTKRESPDIPVDGIKDAIGKTEDHLKEIGAIGENDSIESMDKTRKIGETEIVKLQQHHRGIPVWGAETTVVVSDKKISDIETKSIADIDISIEPELTYEETIDKAGELLGKTLEPQGEGKLVVYKEKNKYTLAWYGLVAEDGEVKNFIFDSTSAAVLHQYSEAIVGL